MPHSDLEAVVDGLTSLVKKYEGRIKRAKIHSDSLYEARKWGRVLNEYGFFYCQLGHLRGAITMGKKVGLSNEEIHKLFLDMFLDHLELSASTQFLRRKSY